MDFASAVLAPYNWLKRILPQPGAQNNAFQGTATAPGTVATGLPVVQYQGAGVAVANPFNPLSGPQVYQNFQLPPNVFAGTQAGAIHFGQPSLETFPNAFGSG